MQEQRGLYGAIVVEPKEKQWSYDHDLTLVLSDWTDEKPREVLRRLKRGSEWYSIKKRTTQSLYQVIKHKAMGAQFQMWKQRMHGMDISDVYYPAFLINGQQEQNYPHFKAGEKIRLRVINAGASTYFWLSFGTAVLLISADGIDVQPVLTNKILHAIGETYDFLFTLPHEKAVEFRATAQDGSGFTTALIGKGESLKAPLLPKPDLMEQMKSMSKSHGPKGHGKRHHPLSHKKNTHQEKNYTDNNSPDHQNHSKQENHGKDKSEQNKKTVNQENGKMEQNQNHTIQKNQSSNKLVQAHQIHQEGKHENETHHKPTERHIPLSGYNHLKAVTNTQFSKTLLIREIYLNLTGNMRRYVWSMNEKVLSESDKIKINQDEIVRIILHNKTMMHHPMHLHGHFFRVLNKQGDYSPLKHTVDVPPMEIVVLEFAPNEKGDWFFHCHVLYHMKGGMARVFSRGNMRDPRLKDFPLSRLWNTDRLWYTWGELSLMTNRADLQWETSNTRNRIHFTGTVSWVDKYYRPHKNYELETSYEYFFTNFFRVYGGLKAQNPHKAYRVAINNIDMAGKIGVRYLLPYLVELDINLDHKKRLELEFEYELLLLSRLELFTDWSWTEYFTQKDQNNAEKRKQEWSIGLNYTINSSLSLLGSYDSHFGWGTGINWIF